MRLHRCQHRRRAPHICRHVAYPSPQLKHLRLVLTWLTWIVKQTVVMSTPSFASGQQVFAALYRIALTKFRLWEGEGSACLDGKIVEDADSGLLSGDFLAWVQQFDSSHIAFARGADPTAIVDGDRGTLDPTRQSDVRRQACVNRELGCQLGSKNFGIIEVYNLAPGHNAYAVGIT